MALVEIDEEDKNVDIESGAVNILLALRKRLSLRFLGEYKPFPKLFYKRCKEHGYSFWTNENECTIEDYIRYGDLCGLYATYFRHLFRFSIQIYARCAGGWTTNWQQKIHWNGIWCSVQYAIDEQPFGNMGDSCVQATNYWLQSRRKFIHTHSGNFEIFPENSLLIYFIPKITDSQKVLFRIHHSLGDGVALLRLFLETIADRENSKKNLWAHCVRARQKLKVCFENDFTTPTFEQKFSIWKSIFTLNCREFQRLWNRFKSYVLNLCRKMIIFYKSPASIIHQGFFKKIDENCLHQQKLKGEKVC